MAELRQNAEGRWEEHPPPSCPACGTAWGAADGTVSPGWEFGRTWQCRSCGHITTESGRTEPIRYDITTGGMVRMRVPLDGPTSPGASYGRQGDDPR